MRRYCRERGEARAASVFRELPSRSVAVNRWRREVPILFDSELRRTRKSAILLNKKLLIKEWRTTVTRTVQATVTYLRSSWLSRWVCTTREVKTGKKEEIGKKGDRFVHDMGVEQTTGFFLYFPLLFNIFFFYLLIRNATETIICDKDPCASFTVSKIKRLLSVTIDRLQVASNRFFHLIFFTLLVA